MRGKSIKERSSLIHGDGIPVKYIYARDHDCAHVPISQLKASHIKVGPEIAHTVDLPL